MQLCLAYAYGGDASAQAGNVAKSVSRTLYGIPMTYYFAIDESGIGPMCDDIGGVSLNALDTIPDTNIEAGDDVILTGYNAYRYVQYRDITEFNSPLDRQARQEQFVKAFAQQALAQTHGGIDNLVALYNTAVQYSVTNLGATDFSYLATAVANNGITDITVTSLTGEMTEGTNYQDIIWIRRRPIRRLDTYYTQVD